jgi:hypothetical protein
MSTSFESLISSAPLPDPKTLETQPTSSTAAQNDPLIAHGWQKATYVGSAVILIGVLVVVGIVSRKIELVLGVGLLLSLLLICGVLILAL